MSYGPQLPPHLQQQRAHQSSSSSDDEGDGEDIGPKLPSQPCLGIKPGTSSSYGPQLPPNHSAPSAGPALLVESESNSDDDDEIIGPRPPKPGEEEEAELRRFLALQKNASKTNAPPKRESWMTELPTTLSKNFGLGPRTFSRSSGPKLKQDKSWTQAPNEAGSSKETVDDEENPEEDKDVLEYLASLKRDEEMEKIASDLRQKRGSESLMTQHSKKIKKAKKEASNQPQERRPFDRDIDLKANQFDEAQKKSMLKKAAQIDDRFSRGAQKFL